MSAQKITPAILAKARAMRAEGINVREIAEVLEVGKSQLAAALAAGTPAPKPPRVPVVPSPSVGNPDAIDADGDPLAVARGLLASLTESISDLEADSPRLNGARAEARHVTKLIAALERERAKVETPEETERRLRREDGETRKEIEQYVEKAERKAEADGVCLKCGRPK